MLRHAISTKKLLLGTYYYGCYYYVVTMGVRLKRAIKLFKNNVLSLYLWKIYKNQIIFNVCMGYKGQPGRVPGTEGRPKPWKNCLLIFKKQFFLLFVNLLINVRHLSIYILKSALKYSNIYDKVDFLNTSNKSAQF